MILGHKQPTSRNGNPQVLVEWESGERTYEPAKAIFDSNKYLLAEYARNRDLLDEWDKPSLPVKDAIWESDRLLRTISATKILSYA